MAVEQVLDLPGQWLGPASSPDPIPPGYGVTSIIPSGSSARVVLGPSGDQATDRMMTAPDGSPLPGLVLQVDAAGAVSGPDPLDPEDPPSADAVVPGAIEGDGVLWSIGRVTDGGFEIRQHDVETGTVLATGAVQTRTFDPGFGLRTSPVAINDQLYVLVSGFDAAGTPITLSELHRLTATS